MEDLIEPYRHTRKILRALRTLNTDRGERQIIGEMIGDCDYTLQWLRTGRRPGSMRGIERRYRIRTWDPEWIEKYESKRSRHIIERDVTANELSKQDRFKIEEAMRELSERERQCFMMFNVDLMSLEEIAAELNLGKSTVQSYVDRAKEKIDQAKISNIFLSL